MDQIKKLYHTSNIEILGYKRGSAIYKLHFVSGWCCFGKSSCPWIIRVFDKDHDTEFHIHSLLMDYPHPNLMRYINRTEVGDEVHYRYEYLDGMTLKDYVKHYEVSDDLLLQLISGVKHLHMLKLLHCDLKPDNIIIINHHTNNPILKIIDYDLVQCIGNRETVCLDRTVGTLNYVAPESFHINLYGKHSDIWSLGMVFFYVFTKNLPYQVPATDNNSHIQRSNYYHDIDIKLSEIKDKHKCELIKKMLEYRYEDRITLEEIEKFILEFHTKQ